MVGLPRFFPSTKSDIAAFQTQRQGRNRIEFGTNIALQILFLILILLLHKGPATQRAESRRLGAEDVSLTGYLCSLTGSPYT